jgi:hypothetical protein
VTTFSRADGFATIGRHHEIVDAGSVVDVQLLGRDLQLADLVVIGSHCIGLDYLLGELQRQGLHTKFLAVGSTAGLDAARRGECDCRRRAPARSDTGEYNTAVLTPGSSSCRATAAAGRRVPPRRSRFENARPSEAIARRCADPDCLMVNRNQGSGTRVLIDRLLGGARRTATPCSRAITTPWPPRWCSAAPTGADARNRGAQRRPRLPAGAARAVRLRGATGARANGRPCRVQGAAAAAGHA